MENNGTRIRTMNYIPCDRNGVHATGREVWTQAAAGNWTWVNEYEDDDTVNLPDTDDPVDYDI